MMAESPSFKLPARRSPPKPTFPPCHHRLNTRWPFLAPISRTWDGDGASELILLGNAPGQNSHRLGWVFSFRNGFGKPRQLWGGLKASILRGFDKELALPVSGRQLCLVADRPPPHMMNEPLADRSGYQPFAQDIDKNGSKELFATTADSLVAIDSESHATKRPSEK
jgi:hypothetical protein